MECEVDVLTFWQLTPFELNLIVERYYKRRREDLKEQVTLLYLNAMWPNMKKIPSLTKVLKDFGFDEPKTKKKEMAAHEMLNIVQMMNAALGGDTN